MESAAAAAAVQSYPEGPTIADVFLQSLEEAGVDYIFAVLGSDHASLIEAYQHRLDAGRKSPKMLIFHHEFVAISAADGYARITNRPQCVLVHVDVGTAALGQGLHNASSGKVPLLIFAGEAPKTLDGAVRGSRSEHVQWYQDVFAQDRLVEPYSRYSSRLTPGEDVQLTVQRALLMATTGCPGPVYLTATREVLASPATVRTRKRPAPSCRVGGLPSSDIALIGEALLTAEAPLAVTGYLGRNHAAVEALVQLANLVQGLQVFDSEFREMSFPANHPAKVTQRTGARPAIETADVILVLDADVPWIPTKERMQLFDIGAEATYNADSQIALEELCTYIGRSERLASHASTFKDRWERLQQKNKDRLQSLANLASPRPDNSISVDILFSALRKSMPSDTVFASDVVTNQVPLSEQLQLSTPGTNFTKGGSGLGWAGGAALGIKLATRPYNLDSRPNVRKLDQTQQGSAPDRLVCCVCGDGSFLFSSADAVFLASTRLDVPFLTVVVNNGGWKATRSCINDVHPGGAAARASDDVLGIDLSEVGPDYVGIAKASSGNRMWGKQVRAGDELAGALEEAVKVVLEERRSAILEVVVT
ncbi:hypothetical protein MBLNU459_g6018t2 [Dothideomycetes sp. NU459]